MQLKGGEENWTAELWGCGRTTYAQQQSLEDIPLNFDEAAPMHHICLTPLLMAFDMGGKQQPKRGPCRKDRVVA